MTVSPKTDADQKRALLADLRQLIAALDRRVPQLSHSGEAKIADEAAALRERAIDFIRQVEGAAPGE